MCRERVEERHSALEGGLLLLLPSQEKTETSNSDLIAHTFGNKFCWVLQQNSAGVDRVQFVFPELLIRRFVRDALLPALGVKIMRKVQVKKLQ